MHHAENMLHGHNQLFGSAGLKGTTGWFETLCLRPAAGHARMAEASEDGLTPEPTDRAPA
jgi:hypothetical protein